jgi:hypothetical protein
MDRLPFQKNIHQLPKAEFIDCLYDLFFARAPKELLGKHWREPPPEETFEDMIYARLGKSIAEKFLIPYNEKLYATKLSNLDKDAMGRFFPKADLVDVVRNMKEPDNATYNATFTYPEGGAIEYVKALATGVPDDRIALSERVVAIDVERKVATTTKREIGYRRLVSSMPFPALAEACGLAHDRSVFSWNKVLVFNLGFDKKGPKHVHWVYYPSRARAFYRIGFYDNIFDTDRMSLYVELGYPKDAEIEVEEARARVLEGLREEELVTDHRLVAEHPRRDGPGLRAHHEGLERGGRAAQGRARGEGRPFHRALRELDLLLDRGQHRRGEGARRRVVSATRLRLPRACARARPRGRSCGAAQSKSGTVTLKFHFCMSRGWWCRRCCSRSTRTSARRPRANSPASGTRGARARTKARTRRSRPP